MLSATTQRLVHRLSRWFLDRGRAKGTPRRRRPGAPLDLEPLENRELLTGGTWTPLANLAPDPSGTQVAMLLSDGTVMVQGGSDSASNSWYKLTPDATGSYVNGSWSTLAPMGLQRLFFPSDVLPDGRVFVVGGEYTGPNTTETLDNTGQIYDPVANTWSNITNFPQANFGDDPTEVLSNGTVIGGYVFGPQTYIYNPSTDTWTQAGTKLLNDRSDEESWVKLANGSILSYNVFASQTAQYYVPSQNQWVSAGSVPVQLETPSGFELGPAFLLQNGQAFFIGARPVTALYTPPTTPNGTGSWVAGPAIPGGLGANDAPGAELPNGDVLFAVGQTPSFGNSTTFLEYDPTTNAISQVNLPPALAADMAQTPSFINFLLDLPNGQVLLSDATDQLWVFTPSTGAGSAAVEPAITSITGTGPTYTLTGTQLNGVSEGAAYGDDAAMASNYPIVGFTDQSGNTAYGRTFDWSSTGVQTGSTPITTQFTVPALNPGSYLMSVDASGIASSNNALFLEMGPGFNNMTLRLNPQNTAQLQVLEGGNVLQTVPLNSITNVYAFGTTGNDSLTLDYSNGNPLPATGLTYAGGTADTLATTGNASNTWQINSADTGVVDGNITFSSVGSLLGETGTNVFTLAAGASLSGGIDGGNQGTLDLSALSGASNVTLTGTGAVSGFNGTVAQVAGGFLDISTLHGTNAPNTLTGPNTTGNLWLVNSPNAGQLSNSGDTFNFTSFASLVGNGTNTFQLGGGTLSGSVTGSGTDTLIGDNTVTNWTVTASNAGTVTGIGGTFSGIANLVGGTANDTFQLAGGTLTGSINGGAGSGTNTLIADNVNNVFVVTGPNRGTVTGVAGGFQNIGRLVGGTQTNVFQLSGGTLTSSITGSGNDTLIAANVPNTWTITGPNSGQVTGVVGSFTGIANLVGGTAGNTFRLANGGSLTGSITGGGNDMLIGADVPNTWIITGSNSGTVTNVAGGFTGIGNVVGGSSTDSFQLAGGSLTGSVSGGGGNDTLQGGNTANTWLITSTNSGTVTGGGGGFTGISNLVGGSVSDNFQLSGGTLTGTITGGSGSETLTGDNVANTFIVTGPNSGTATGVGGGFSGIGNLTGGTISNTFRIEGGTLSGAIAGDGSDTLTADNVANTWKITGPNSGTVTGVGSFSGIANLVGGTVSNLFQLVTGGSLTGKITGNGSDTVQGANGTNLWTLTGTNAGVVTNVAGGFTGISNLTGGTGADTFRLAGGTLTGSIAGGGGNDTLQGANVANSWSITGTNSGTVNGVGGGFTAISNLVGGSVSDLFQLQGGSLAGTITGGSGAETLQGGNGATTWTLTGVNAGKVTGVSGFSGIGTLIGSTGNDTFQLAGGSVTGSITGNGGTDTLQGGNTANTWAITGANSGTVTGVGGGFTGISNLAGGSVSDRFQLAGGSLSGSITGGSGTETLVGADTANTWTITGANAGSVNGVGGGFSGIGNLTGNAVSDAFNFAGGSLTGTIKGGSGAATVLLDFSKGVPANPVTFAGGSGSNSLVAQNGSFTNETFTPTNASFGTLTFDGFSATYSGRVTVTNTSSAANLTVNGLPQGGALSILNGISVNGTTTTEATQPNAFVLYFANQATVAVDGGSQGSTSFSLSNPNPAAGLKSLSLNAGTGGDAFTITPSATIVYQANGLSSNPAKTLAVSTAGTTNPTLTSQQNPNGSFSGTWTFGNRQPVSFTNIDAVSPSVNWRLALTATPIPINFFGQIIGNAIEGGQIRYTITVANGGPTDAANSVISFPIPANAVFVSSTLPGYNSTTGLASVGTITNGETETWIVVVRAVEEGSLSASLGVTSDVQSSDPGGSSLALTTPVADAPLYGFSLALPTATEGQSFTGTVAAFADPNAFAPLSDFTAAIVWGDGHTSAGQIQRVGSSVYSVMGTNTYAEEGAYPVLVMIADVGGQTLSISQTATVADAPLTATALPVTTAAGVSFTGPVATFTDANPSAPLSDFTASIVWGDGATTPGVVSIGTGGFIVSGTHAYGLGGGYTFQVTINDKGGSTASATGTATATGAPSNVTALALSAVAGQAFSGAVGSFQDANLADPAGTFTATITWGDGTTSPGSISGGQGSFTVSGTHTYANSGAYTTQVSVANAAGGTSTTAVGTATVTPTPVSTGIIVAGAAAGGGPQVNVYDAATGALRFSFFAFNPAFTGGVTVAVGDVDGTGVPDVIVGAGPSGGPNVRVYNGLTGQLLPGAIGNFFAFAPQFTGGVYVASGDVNDDGFADVIVGAGAGGGANVTVFSGKDGSQLYSLFPFSPQFTGGVRVAAADVTGDGHADIIAAPGPGGGSNVVVLNGATGGVLSSFTAFQNFAGGLFVAGADLYGTGRAEVIASKGPGSTPDVAVFDGTTGGVLSAFSAFNPAFTGGVGVAGLNASKGGNGEIVTAPGAGGTPDVQVRDGVTAAILDQFFAFNPLFQGGVYIAAGS